MSKEQNTIQLIESYLEKNMSLEARDNFEHLLEQDPILRSEVEMQQQLINSIKDFRKAELKAQLNNVTVGVGPMGFLSIKTAAILAITAIVGVGTYLYLQKDSSVTEITPITEHREETISSDQELTLPEEVPSIAVAEEMATPEPASKKSEPIAKTAKTTSKASQPNQDQGLIEPAAVSVPTVIQPSKEENDLSIDELEMPNEKISQLDKHEQNALAVENTVHTEYNFHYQFYQDKLFLYGDFKDTPYEILELNFSNGKKLFMYYRGAYYPLMENQVEIASLEALTDQEIIKKLEIIKANK